MPLEPRPAAGLRRLRRILGRRRADALVERLERIRGPWRIAVAEASMLPALRPGDWLLVDPLIRRWPRRGSLVVFREPGSAALAIKRVAGRPRDWVPFADGYLHLAEDEAWLLSDADAAATAAAGHGPPVDSRRYGPVTADRLIARAWFRYAPLRRVGPLDPAPRRLDRPAAPADPEPSA
ncbi:MAG TPA: S26 family signal peptidase [Candidatus Dormibacteraeota bacterium]|nr:S26 family signal peptidase [Candidatus Dormibacteraeota bacterium]